MASNIQSIPYGDRMILMGERTVLICDQLLLIEDYPTQDALMAAIKQAYDNYKDNFSG